MPNNRMRWPWISIVSPSMTEARPVRSAALAQNGQYSRMATAKKVVRPMFGLAGTQFCLTKGGTVSLQICYPNTGIFTFLFVIITMALVVAFWAELRGMFDVEDENNLLPALRGNNQTR